MNVSSVCQAEEEVQDVAMETVEGSRLNATQRRRARIMRNVDSE